MIAVRDRRDETAKRETIASRVGGLQRFSSFSLFMGFMRARRSRGESGDSTDLLRTPPKQRERVREHDDVKPPQADAAVQCSCAWPSHGIDGALHTAASLNRRFDVLVAQSRPADAESNCKAVQANLPWASHQIVLPPVPKRLYSGPSAWDTAVEAFKSERSPEKRVVNQLRASCSCTLVHVCGAAAFQPIYARSASWVTDAERTLSTAELTRLSNTQMLAHVSRSG